MYLGYRHSQNEEQQVILFERGRVTLTIGREAMLREPRCQVLHKHSARLLMGHCLADTSPPVPES